MGEAVSVTPSAFLLDIIVRAGYVVSSRAISPAAGHVCDSHRRVEQAGVDGLIGGKIDVAVQAHPAESADPVKWICRSQLRVSRFAERRPVYCSNIRDRKRVMAAVTRRTGPH